MIRPYQPSDIDSVLSIWLAASIQAHDFIDSGFWESKLGDMRRHYLPASENHVTEVAGQVAGFYSLYENTLAAIFVQPGYQGQGLGRALLDDAKNRRKHLQLTVYARNAPSIHFYRQQGFVTAGEQMDAHTGEPELLMQWSWAPSR
ncbi:putative acetyltransferase [Vreelandella songnenensis]|uniref:Putative acetyltransferase n=1 Tax=Vreelandella songnenensis TaxID=1176243 RepID=A0A2T0UZS8_9GAMM|nr:N-acetyltransferase [Halomonas songnenensis]PRY63411.1 putative acetyltransferase [Halomonas songnenensis]